jgi:hypothetical protein
MVNATQVTVASVVCVVILIVRRKHKRGSRRIT